MDTEFRLDQSKNIFLTPAYATYALDASKKHMRPKSELMKTYENFCSFRDGLISFGFSIGDKDEIFSFKTIGDTRRVRALPLYVPAYLDFLNADVKESAVNRVVEVNEFQAPLFRYSLASHKIASIPLEGNPFFRKGMISVFGEQVVELHAGSMFDATKALGAFGEVFDEMGKLITSYGFEDSSKARSYLLAMIHFFGSGKSCYPKLMNFKDFDFDRSLKYVLEAEAGGVELLPLMITLSRANYTAGQMGTKETFTPILTAAQLVEYKDTPVSYLKEIMQLAIA